MADRSTEKDKRVRFPGKGWLFAASIGGWLASLAVAKHMALAAAAVMLPMLLAAGLLLLSHPEWIVWLTVIPSTANDHIGIKAGGINLRLYNVLAMAGFAWLALNMAIKTRVRALSIARRYFPLFLPLMAFAASKVMTVVMMSEFPFGMERMFSAKFVIFSILLLATAYVTLFMIERRRTLELLVKGWIHMANVVWVIAIVQLLLSNIFHFHLVHHRNVIWFGRPYSVFREPDVLGSFVGATVLMVMPMLVWDSKLMSRRYMSITLALQGILLLILFVRAAWIATIVGVMLWSVSAIRISQFKPVLAYLNRGMALSVVMVMLLPILVPSFVETLVGRFASLSKPTEEGASEYRLRELTAMVTQTLPDGIDAAAIERFLFGHGDFSWSYWAPHLLGENYDRTAVEKMQAGGSVLIHPGFCMTLSIFFDNGALGLLFLMTFVVLLFRNYYRTLDHVRGGAREDQILVISTFLPVICILTCFQFSYDPISPFLWALIGLHLSATYFVTTPDRFEDFEPMSQVAVRLGLAYEKGADHAAVT